MLSNQIYFEGVASRKGLSLAAPEPPMRQVAPITSPAVIDFFQLLFTLAGLSMAHYRRSALLRRVRACLRFLRVQTIELAQQKLRSTPSLAAELMDVVLLGATEFFRDRPVFDHLEKVLAGEFRDRGKPLRIWSAACSDGRELYSVAFVLARAGLLERAELLGTDCRADAIRRASAGEFTREAWEKLEKASPRLDLGRDGSMRVFHESIRGRIRWKRADLCARAEPGPWDLILWRNMAIYLDPAAAGSVWDSILEQLPSGGYLVTGKADHLPSHSRLQRSAPCIYRKA